MNAVAVILGGGAGRRLQPLTGHRAKPAVPIAGKYRLVDIPISNCLNSNIRRIFVLTQFNSVSLHQHMQSTYRFDQFHKGFVRILAAQQTPGKESWYQGTADAVRQMFRYVRNEYPDYIVILSGDQLYRMDFQDVLRRHEESGADLTISTTPVARDEAGALGIMQVDADQRITRFVEKPGDAPVLDELRAPMYDDERYLASMGIYVFNRDVLVELLSDEGKSDFGHDIIPVAIKDFKVNSHVFDGYWKDIGTIGAFWEANLALTEIMPKFTFYDTHAPVFTHMRYLPPSKINCCEIKRCLLSDGCIISGDRLLHSIVGIRALIGEGSVIEDSVIMGADFYEKSEPTGMPPIGIGKNCHVERAIIDKNARIGDGAYISPEGKKDKDITEQYTISDGIIVIPKNAVIPAGTKL